MRLSIITSWLFPELCVGCKARGASICTNCLSAAPIAEPQPADWVASLYAYGHPSVRAAIWALKFKGKWSIASAFARPLADLSLTFFEETLPGPELDVVIVPIPPSPAGKKKRRYNQSAYLADALREEIMFSAFVFYNALIRVRVTARQAEIKNRHERLSNMHNVFRADKSVHGKTILLVDDVTTTGATLTDARRACLEAGAAEVFAVTIAH